MNGKFDGRGLILKSHGSNYLGEFKENTMNGKGIKIYYNEKRYNGS